jgi:LuxR family transcriptional regulator, maltose regulon positive regulatory protein
MLIPQIIRTKISPPRTSARALERERVTKAFDEIKNYRLTLLQASTGYGKSTSLTYLSQTLNPVIWYQVTEDDNDLFVFLLHLLYATQLALPTIDGMPIPLLEGWDNIQDPLPIVEILHQYLNALSSGLDKSTILILDDIHLVMDVPEIAQALDRIISLAPSNLSILLSSRMPVKLPNLSRWQAHGDVLFIDQNNLKFTEQEISDLFNLHYKNDLSDDDVAKLFQLTEGWAIALQLIWQSLRSGAVSNIDEVIKSSSQSLSHLFEVLTHQVMHQQPNDIQEFLQISATLRIMTPEACNALRQKEDSDTLLAYLRQHELFVANVGETADHQSGLRYHPIFHQFLRDQSNRERSTAWHISAAHHFIELRNFDTALHHLVQAQDYNQAAQLLSSYGSQLLAMGRLDTLSTYLDNIDPEFLHQYPALLTYHGDLARLHSRFQEALGWYQQAEAVCKERGRMQGVGRALRGQARVYLDTVSPSRAEELLQQALRLSDGTADREAQARLYELLAENKLNAGKVEAAERLQQQAVSLRLEGPTDSHLQIRVLLRTGRLDEAKKKLQERVEIERQAPVHTPRSHRETQLLLSIIHAMQGDAEAAYQSALEGTRRGEEFNSLFVIAVGYMRQGHALMLLSASKQYIRAREQFQQAIEISRTLAVPRLRLEACWGLCRTFQEDLKQALRVAEEGIELAKQAGDEWNASLVRLTMGANLILNENYQTAAEWLRQAVRGFRECSDPFCANIARLWLCLGWYRQGDFEQLAQILPGVLSACRQRGYDYIFTRPTLFGTPDERLSIPLLILARDQGWEGSYPQNLLRSLGLGQINLHPGYQLRVQTLGAFQVWRGDQPIPQNGWRREKSRQLFQVLLINRHSPLDRDQLCEHLWPGADPETSQRNFKVALSTLYNVLEPERAPGSDSAYIERSGTAYGIRPQADLWLDAEDFECIINNIEGAADAETLRQTINDALDLYKGEFIPEARYETWAAGERERLSVLHLRATDRYCQLSLDANLAEEVVRLCQHILSLDNCWERAYRHMMLAHDQLGDRGQIARTYQRCVDTLRDELDVAPSLETVNLYQQLTSQN